MVSILDCDSGDRGSIPRRVVFFFHGGHLGFENPIHSLFLFMSKNKRVCMGAAPINLVESPSVLESRLNSVVVSALGL